MPFAPSKARQANPFRLRRCQLRSQMLAIPLRHGSVGHGEWRWYCTRTDGQTMVVLTYRIICPRTRVLSRVGGLKGLRQPTSTIFAFLPPSTTMSSYEAVSSHSASAENATSLEPVRWFPVTCFFDPPQERVKVAVEISHIVAGNLADINKVRIAAKYFLCWKC